MQALALLAQAGVCSKTCSNRGATCGDTSSNRCLALLSHFPRLVMDILDVLSLLLLRYCMSAKRMRSRGESWPTCQLAWRSVAPIFVIGRTRLRLGLRHGVVSILSIAKEVRVPVAPSGWCRGGSVHVVLLRRHITTGSAPEQITLSSIVIKTTIASSTSPWCGARRVATVSVPAISTLVSVLVVSEAIRGGRLALVGRGGGVRSHARTGG